MEREHSLDQIIASLEESRFHVNSSIRSHAILVRSILLINTPVDHNIICYNSMKQIATHRFHQRLAGLGLCS